MFNGCIQTRWAPWDEVPSARPSQRLVNVGRRSSIPHCAFDVRPTACAECVGAERQQTRTRPSKRRLAAEPQRSMIPILISIQIYKQNSIIIIGHILVTETTLTLGTAMGIMRVLCAQNQNKSTFSKPKNINKYIFCRPERI